MRVCVQVRVCLCIRGASLSLPGTPRPLGTPAHPFFLPHQDGGVLALAAALGTADLPRCQGKPWRREGMWVWC